MRNRIGFVLVCLATHGSFGRNPPPDCVVEVEEEVYSYQPANNGAGPMWCSGSTCLVRAGGRLYASGIETLDGVQPLNNCRWLLFKREQDGWQLLKRDPVDRTREPCPIVGFPDGRLFLSVNPTRVADKNAYSGPARPEILQFDGDDPKAAYKTILPRWRGNPGFTEHSYRSFAADGTNGELILFQNIGYTHAEWAFLNRDATWSSSGKLAWPWGAEYDQPQPIRICYPNVALTGRTVHFCGVSDIVEPYEKWREYKHQLTGRQWDYDFRRLFYTCTTDITSGPFSDWVEISSRDKTCGWISPGDLHVAADGTVHLLWTERAIDTRLRDRFFPNEKQIHSLHYARVRHAKVIYRKVLLMAEEGKSNERPGCSRFQVTPDNGLFVVFYVGGTDRAGNVVSENRILELDADGTASEQSRLPLKHPLNSFFTATLRGGSPPSRMLDMLGTRADTSNTVSYARVRLGIKREP